MSCRTRGMRRRAACLPGSCGSRDSPVVGSDGAGTTKKPPAGCERLAHWVMELGYPARLSIMITAYAVMPSMKPHSGAAYQTSGTSFHVLGTSAFRPRGGARLGDLGGRRDFDRRRRV